VRRIKKEKNRERSGKRRKKKRELRRNGRGIGRWEYGLAVQRLGKFFPNRNL